MAFLFLFLWKFFFFNFYFRGLGEVGRRIGDKEG